jgi:hexosaminidase
VIRTGDQLEYQAFPRLLAFAERAWHKGSWETSPINPRVLQEDWKMFVNTVGYKELSRLNSLGIKYRIAPPGAM